jgi:hypothetical protein
MYKTVTILYTILQKITTHYTMVHNIYNSVKIVQNSYNSVHNCAKQLQFCYTVLCSLMAGQ